MRKILEKQLQIGQVDIGRIQINIHSRDEIPQLLLGLQAIYRTHRLREHVFKILKRIVPRNTDPKQGRPGMDLWKILVLGTVRLNCNFGYDKLLEIANEHKIVREFLGHSIYEFQQRYALQTIKDNVSLLTPELLDQINQVVVSASHELLGKKAKRTLHGRCDSFVVETDVHYPTDINLLWDATRKATEPVARECGQLGISKWRQSRHILLKIKKLFNTVRKLKRSTSSDARKKAARQQLIVATHQAYIDTAQSHIDRVQQTIAILQQMGLGNVDQTLLIKNFISPGQRQIDKIRRRLIAGQSIPHQEKVFSIFEPHTEWIIKGKAGVPQELGLKVSIIEDQYGFILHHQVMQQQTDDQVAVPLIIEAKRKFANLTSCSFDKGFHSPDNQRQLAGLLDLVVLPRKGRLSLQAKAIETSEPFTRVKRRHAAVESAINALENHGLDRCPDHGSGGFERYVALAVLARNLQILGAVLQKKARRHERRMQRAAGRQYRLAA